MSKATDYQNRYEKEKCIQVHLKFNKETDSDVIDILSQVKNKQGFIKALIRLNDSSLDEYGIFETFAKHSQIVRDTAKAKGIDPEDVKLCSFMNNELPCNSTSETCEGCIRYKIVNKAISAAGGKQITY